MNNHKCYINDNKIIIKIDKVYEFISNSINNGTIINKNLFINDYKENINNKSIFTNKIDILLNKDINEQDILYYNNIFEELNYSKVRLLSTKDYLDNNVLIPNNDIYIIYTNNTYYYIYPFLLNEFLLKRNITKLKIISSKKLKTNNNCKYYYYENSNHYFI